MDDSNGSSDSVEFSATGNSPVLNGHMEMEPIGAEDDGLPKLIIVEQPQQRGFRFRYECEGPSHGGLQGSSSERYRKTVPTVKVKNYSGSVRVTVNLVTDEPVPKCHAHKLVGKNCQNGTCIIEVKAGTSQIAFPNLCIQHVTRRKAAEVLEQRICDEMLLNKRIIINNLSAKLQLTDDERTNAKIQADKQAKSMQLNVVRLCFQAFLLDNNGTPATVLPSVISDPIYDSKAPGANALKICRMDKYSGCCTGNDEVFLLCEKVQKDDIQVRFVEQDVEGTILWQAYGHFGPFDVHRQFAIVFKTPEYRDITINKPVNVLVSLQRKSDGEYSDPKSFTYYPRSFDKEDIERKRRKILPHYTDQRGNFGDMNSFNGGDNSNGGSNSGMSNGSSNGMQNGGGTIPDFENLRTFPMAAELGGINGSSRQKWRLISRKPAMFQKIAGSLLNDQADDLLAQSSHYMYEEIQKRSPPCNAGHMQFYGAGSATQQVIGGMSAAMTSNPMSPYSQGSLSMGSPQNITSSYGNESHLPQRALTSPQNIDHSQGIGYSSQHGIIGSSNLSLPVTQSTTMPSSQITQMQVDLQMLSNDLVSQQLVQVSDLGSVNPEPDCLMYNTTMQQLQCFEKDLYFNPSMKTFDDYSPYVFGTCAYQARGASGVCDTDLQDVMAVLDMVDGAPPRESTDAFDEVDSSAGDQMDLRTRGACLISDKDFLAGCSPKASSKVSNPVKEKLVRNEDYVVMKPFIAKEPKITSTQSEQPPLKCDTAAQTEMDPMIKLAMKTSQAVQYYAASGDVRSILMVQRFLMSVQDTDGDLPLHTALINEKFEVFQNILDVMVTLPDACNRINAFSFHLQTPLHLAVITNQPKAIDLLIRAGADTRLVDRNGYTPAHLAVLYNHNACLINLLKYMRPGVDDPKHPFPELNTRCYDGFTPVHLAAQHENLTAMKLLVYGKADVNLADGKSGRSPLHHSVEADDLSLAAYLILQAGANVNAKRFDGNTPLHIACGHNNVGMVALLMAGGADPTIKNNDPLEFDSEDDSSDDNKELTNGVPEETKDMPMVNDHNDKINGTNSDDSDSEENDLAPCKGLLPAHFANHNENILRVLNGKPYMSLRDSPIADQKNNNTTEKLTFLKVSTESGIGSLKVHSISSDMNKLEYPIRLQLSELLDPSRIGCDWQALADRLGMQYLLQGDMGENSPTRLLLTYFEANGGTISQLSQALEVIKRDDCVTLLHNIVKENEKDMPVQKDSIFDSGMWDSFRKSSSPIHKSSSHIGVLDIV